MKNTYIIILLFLFFLFLKCSKESTEIEKVNALPVPDHIKELQSNIVLESGEEMYVTFNSIGEEGSEVQFHPDLTFAIMAVEKENPEPSQWRPLDQIFREKYAELISSWEDEVAYTLDIQEFSYRIIDKYLLKVPATKETMAAVAYYMDHLMRHKGVDLRVMTDAVLALRGWVPTEKLKGYESYILQTAHEQLPEYEEWIEKTRADYFAETDEVEKLWKKAQLKHYILNFKAAQYAIQSLEPKN